MKKIIILLTFLLTASISSYGQIFKPVKWTTSVKKVSAGTYNLIATATIDAGWHLYSQTVPKGGPIPTAFVFKENDNYSLRGKTIEGKGHTVDDPVFNMEITFFEDKAIFTQPIKLNAKGKTKIIGEVEFMVCDDTKCLPPDYVDLEFTIE